MFCNSESSSRFKELLWTLYQKSAQLVNASNFALALYDDSANTLSFPLIFQQGKRIEPFSIKLSNNQDLASRVLKSQTPLLIHNLPATGIIVKADPICPDQPVRSWLSVPISTTTREQKARGLITVWSDQPNAFSGHQLQLLSELAAQAAIALRDARSQESPLNIRDQGIEIEDQVRKELARDLHDGPLQLVSALIMRLDICRKTLKKDGTLCPKQMDTLQELAERAVHQMRTTLFALRPVALETRSLVDALQIFLKYRQKAVDMTELVLETESYQPNNEISRQEAKVEAAIYAVVQEAVNNALKHAQAKIIKVHLKETATEICATVSDDGKGFDVDQVLRNYEQQGSLGLINIRERTELIGGSFIIESVPVQGTRITLCVPHQPLNCV